MIKTMAQPLPRPKVGDNQRELTKNRRTREMTRKISEKKKSERGEKRREIRL